MRRVGEVTVFLAMIGGYVLGRAFIAIVLGLFFDRSGDSGRYRHWEHED